MFLANQSKGDFGVCNQMKWIKDELAENIIKKLGLTFTLEMIDGSSIDRKKSRANSAREERLDSSHVENIACSILNDDPIPAIVVRKPSPFVIATGNHRDEACVVAGEPTRYAYVVQCDNAQFIVLCQLLNVPQGKGPSKELRVKHAAEAVQSGSMKVADAACYYHVKTDAIHYYLRLKKAQLTLDARTGGMRTNMPQKLVIELAKIQADSVFNKALEHCTKPTLDVKDTVQLLKDVLSMRTEKDQLNAIETAVVQGKELEKTPVVSPKKKRFLQLLSGIENTLAKRKGDSLDAFDIVADTEGVRARCKTIARILNSL